MTNADLEAIVDTSDEWIHTRTGIRERRIAAEDEPTSALGAKAAERAIEAAHITPDQIDLIITATITPDEPFPNTGCFIQNRIGAWDAACFSLEAACSGFIYALEVAGSMIKCGSFKRILVIGAEKMSSLLNWQDRTTCVLFGDGAGAMVLEACEPAESCVLGSVLGADGRHTQLLHVPAGGSAKPVTPEVLESGEQFLRMNGREIFKLAVNNMVAAAEHVLAETGISIDQVRWLVPHQANTRIITAVAKRLGINRDNCYVNLQRTGNSSAATIPVAVDELVRQDQLNHGDYVLLVAFGGGLTWGASLIRW